MGPMLAYACGFFCGVTYIGCVVKVSLGNRQSFLTVYRPIADDM